MTGAPFKTDTRFLRQEQEGGDNHFHQALARPATCLPCHLLLQRRRTRRLGSALRFHKLLRHLSQFCNLSRPGSGKPRCRGRALTFGERSAVCIKIPSREAEHKGPLGSIVEDPVEPTLKNWLPPYSTRVSPPRLGGNGLCSIFFAIAAVLTTAATVLLLCCVSSGGDLNRGGAAGNTYCSGRAVHTSPSEGCKKKIHKPYLQEGAPDNNCPRICRSTQLNSPPSYSRRPPPPLPRSVQVDDQQLRGEARENSDLSYRIRAT